MSNAAPIVPEADRTDAPLHVALIMDGNGRWAAGHRCDRPPARSGLRWTSDGPSNREDLFFLGRKQLVDFADGAVGRLLHIGGEALGIILGDLVPLLELLDQIEAVAADMADGDARGFRIFVRDLHELLAALLVQFGD